MARVQFAGPCENCWANREAAAENLVDQGGPFVDLKAYCRVGCEHATPTCLDAMRAEQRFVACIHCWQRKAGRGQYKDIHAFCRKGQKHITPVYWEDPGWRAVQTARQSCPTPASTRTALMGSMPMLQHGDLANRFELGGPATGEESASAAVNRRGKGKGRARSTDDSDERGGTRQKGRGNSIKKASRGPVAHAPEVTRARVQAAFEAVLDMNSYSDALTRDTRDAPYLSADTSANGNREDASVPAGTADADARDVGSPHSADDDAGDEGTPADTDTPQPISHEQQQDGSAGSLATDHYDSGPAALAYWMEAAWAYTVTPGVILHATVSEHSTDVPVVQACFCVPSVVQTKDGRFRCAQQQPTFLYLTKHKSVLLAACSKCSRAGVRMPKELPKVLDLEDDANIMGSVAMPCTCLLALAEHTRRHAECVSNMPNINGPLDYLLGRAQNLLWVVLPNISPNAAHQTSGCVNRAPQNLEGTRDVIIASPPDTSQAFTMVQVQALSECMWLLLWSRIKDV